MGWRGPRLVLCRAGQRRPVRPDRAFARAVGDMPCPFPPLVLFTVSRSLVLCSVLRLLASLFWVPAFIVSDRAFARVREPGHLLLAPHLLGPVLLRTPGQGRAFARVLFPGLLPVLLRLLLGLLGLLISRLWDIVLVLTEA